MSRDKIFSSLIFLLFATTVVAQQKFEVIKASLSVAKTNLLMNGEKDLDNYLHYFINEKTHQEAFENLASHSFIASFNLEIKSNQQQDLVSSNGIGRTTNNGNCSRFTYEEREVNGIYYRKNKKLKFFTAKLFESFIHGLASPCNSKRVKAEPRVKELIEILMSPGKAADLQFIGYKTDIFSVEMSKYYNYQISESRYNGKDCILFQLNLKPEFQTRKKKKTIIKSLKSYYDAYNNKSLAKDLVIRYKTPLQNYDINFLTEYETINDQYFPKKIEFQGIWAVIPHRGENSRFVIEFSNLLP